MYQWNLERPKFFLRQENKLRYYTVASSLEVIILINLGLPCYLASESVRRSNPHLWSSRRRRATRAERDDGRGVSRPQGWHHRRTRGAQITEQDLFVHALLCTDILYNLHTNTLYKLGQALEAPRRSTLGVLAGTASAEKAEYFSGCEKSLFVAHYGLDRFDLPSSTVAQRDVQ